MKPFKISQNESKEIKLSHAEIRRPTYDFSLQKLPEERESQFAFKSHMQHLMGSYLAEQTIQNMEQEMIRGMSHGLPEHNQKSLAFADVQAIISRCSRPISRKT